MMTDEEIDEFEDDAMHGEDFDADAVMTLIEEIRRLKALIPPKEKKVRRWLPWATK